MRDMKNELLKKSLETIEKLAAQLSTVKDMLPLDHPVQNQAAYDVEEICNELEAAIKTYHSNPHRQ